MKPISTSTFTFPDLVGGGFVYVFEFKTRGTSAAALAQIKEKRNFERYLSSGDRAVLVGAGFSLKPRNLVRTKIETLA